MDRCRGRYGPGDGEQGGFGCQGARHEGGVTLGQLSHQDTACAGSNQEGAQRDKGRDHRQPPAPRDPEAEQNHVAGHIGREHSAERQLADGINKAGRKRQRQQRPREWMAHAPGTAPECRLVKAWGACGPGRGVHRFPLPLVVDVRTGLASLHKPGVGLNRNRVDPDPEERYGEQV
jgi:hypothetical protein